jgi:hypothetical protein
MEGFNKDFEFKDFMEKLDNEKMINSIQKKDNIKQEIFESAREKMYLNYAKTLFSERFFADVVTFKDFMRKLVSFYYVNPDFHVDDIIYGIYQKIEKVRKWSEKEKKDLIDELKVKIDYFNDGEDADQMSCSGILRELTYALAIIS